MARLISFPETGTGLKILDREIPTGPRAVLGLYVLAFIVALPSAWFVEFVLFIPPCDLCMNQREAYWGALFCGLIGLALTIPTMPLRKAAPYLIWGLMVLGFVSLGYGLIDKGIAAEVVELLYHVMLDVLIQPASSFRSHGIFQPGLDLR